MLCNSVCLLIHGHALLCVHVSWGVVTTSQSQISKTIHSYCIKHGPACQRCIVPPTYQHLNLLHKSLRLLEKYENNLLPPPFLSIPSHFSSLFPRFKCFL
ncbi:hypothetical protein QBC36DRAFT_330015 [Triangularia setosa]|uniref:Secreted protein n=1 Tax=Triangularia setosa TaxID=2587417 RepID=A0AAN6W6Q7_9PEZI|nr:hypothetical protein QBC36DRAFT_330015 [Podospora setosa]